MAGFEYEDNLQAVLNALLAYNTTTSTPDLSGSMTTRVVTINATDPEVTSVRRDEYPAVFVRVRRGEEEAAGLGPTGPTGVRKQKEVTYEVIGLVTREGQQREREQKEDLYNLVRNIEAVFQKEYKLSNTALWCHPESSDFVGPIQGKNGVMVKGAMVTVRAMYHFR